MFQRCGFADARSDIEDADFVIFGLPFDSTTSFRSGSRDAPDAMRHASYNFETYDQRHDIDLADIPICDIGNMGLGSDPACAWEAIKSGLSTLPEEAITVAMGGEHSITPPIVEHLASTTEGGLGVIVLDAHLDLREEYGCTVFSHACVSRRVLEMDGVSGFVSIGIRSGSKEEFRFAADNRISFFTCEDVSLSGIDGVLDEALAALEASGYERIYLSLDFDVIDPAYAPAVGNPEPFGLSPKDVAAVIDRLAPVVAGLDITEITPAYDHGQTAILGARMAREFMATRSKSL